MEEKRARTLARTKAERESDLLFITPLVIDGVPPWKIAEEITKARDYKVSRDMVYSDTRKLLEEWRKHRAKLFDNHKELMIERAEKMWAIACENWELSKKGKTKTIQKQRSYKLKGQDKKKKDDPIILQEQQKHHTESIGDIAWYNAMMDSWNVLYEALDLKNITKLHDPGLDVIPAARDVVFITRSRKKDNEQFTEAVEIPDTEGDDAIQQKLLGI
jgi:CTP synthase (UTP-ammonia lyase)